MPISNKNLFKISKSKWPRRNGRAEVTPTHFFSPRASGLQLTGKKTFNRARLFFKIYRTRAHLQKPAGGRPGFTNYVVKNERNKYFRRKKSSKLQTRKMSIKKGPTDQFVHSIISKISNHFSIIFHFRTIRRPILCLTRR